MSAWYSGLLNPCCHVGSTSIITRNDAVCNNKKPLAKIAKTGAILASGQRAGNRILSKIIVLIVLDRPGPSSLETQPSAIGQVLMRDAQAHITLKQQNHVAASRLPLQQQPPFCRHADRAWLAYRLNDFRLGFSFKRAQLTESQVQLTSSPA